MREMVGHTRTVSIAQSATVSGSFGKPSTGFFFGVLLPAMDSGDVGLQISPDDGATWHTVINPIDNVALALATAGATPLAVDITDKIVAFIGVEIIFRFTCASQSAARELILVFSS
jgi:hypothetical protein